MARLGLINDDGAYYGGSRTATDSTILVLEPLVWLFFFLFLTAGIGDYSGVHDKGFMKI